MAQPNLLCLFDQPTDKKQKSKAFKAINDQINDINPFKNKCIYLRDGIITLYKRPNTRYWHMRFRLYDKKWHRISTGYEDLDYAKRKASEIYDRARFMQEFGLPVISHRFDKIAGQLRKQLQDDLDRGIGKKIYVDYISVIDNYLIPFFGAYKLTSIDKKLIDDFEVWRKDKMKRQPKQSTLLTHSVAYNKVFDLAINNGWLSDKQPFPRLHIKGEKSQARPAFTRAEIDYLLEFMKSWSQGGKTDKAHSGRLLLRDYIEMLLATGMRQGTEAFNIKWKHMEWHIDKGVRYLRIWVSGKTGPRWLIARHEAVAIIERIKARFKEYSSLTLDELLAQKRDDYLWRHSTGERPYDFVSSFKWLMRDSGLLTDAIGNTRSLYSFRHTYATFSLVEWNMDIHTLAKQMGTSVAMLERHYSKLTATMAAEKLAG
ncbi:MAG TPA: hypothetical protein PL140_08455 [Ferrovaceae bacterium]|nr:hypothetical protein [Ferrovaceae bacterium]